MTTVVYEGRESVIEPSAPGNDLWLRGADLERVTGWELKPEGACRDHLCVPLLGTALHTGASFNLSGFARLLGQPELSEAEPDVRVFGRPARTGESTLQALDFALPDLTGREHRLSDYAGQKVFLVSWASW